MVTINQHHIETKYSNVVGNTNQTSWVSLQTIIISTPMLIMLLKAITQWNSGHFDFQKILSIDQ